MLPEFIVLTGSVILGDITLFLFGKLITKSLQNNIFFCKKIYFTIALMKIFINRTFIPGQSSLFQTKGLACKRGRNYFLIRLSPFLISVGCKGKFGLC